jgi:hypothetical protein
LNPLRTGGRTRTGTWCEPDWILSPARLPIPPLRLVINMNEIYPCNKLFLLAADTFTNTVKTFSQMPDSNRSRLCRDEPDWILSPARLPIPPLRHKEQLIISEN